MAKKRNNGKGKKPGFKPKLPPEFEKLTAKQQLFISAYLANGGNGTAAAKTAGYAGDENTLGVAAHDNLRNPKISQQIRERQNEVCKKFEIRYEDLIQELAAIAYFDIRDVMADDARIGITMKPWKEIPRHSSKAIHSMKETSSEYGTNRSITTHDKMRAIDVLMKHTKDADGRNANSGARAALLRRVQDLFSKPPTGDGGGSGSTGGGSTP
jgi:phage terminase small subunit